jgi:hypothetical protein
VETVSCLPGNINPYRIFVGKSLGRNVTRKTESNTKVDVGKEENWMGLAQNRTQYLVLAVVKS